MSRGACITVAIAMLLSAVGFMLTGIFLGADLPAGSWPFYGAAMFCVVIAIACLSKASRPVALRIIGTVIFLTYVDYVYDSIGEENLRQAIVGFFWWGLPSGYLTIWGQWPTWGRWAAAFRPDRFHRQENRENL